MAASAVGGVVSLYLLVHTCGGSGVVALAEDGIVRATETLPARGSSESLLPAIRRVLGGRSPGQLAGVGVVVGPGSFTGVRVGLSAVKGLCEPARVPVISMSRLELLAAAEGQDRVAVLDGGRGEFYFGLKRNDGTAEEGLLGREALLEHLAGLPAVSCEAVVAERLGDRVDLVAEPDAEAMLRLMTRKVAQGAWMDAEDVDANYLRRTDAELAVERAG